MFSAACKQYAACVSVVGFLCLAVSCHLDDQGSVWLMNQTPTSQRFKAQKHHLRVLCICCQNKPTPPLYLHSFECNIGIHEAPAQGENNSC